MAHKGYTLNYFIDFFSSIPTHRWTEGALNNAGTVQMCAIGHALAGPNPGPTRIERIVEGELDSNARLEALSEFVGGEENVWSINDGKLGFGALGETPRGRILKALRNRKRTGNIYGTVEAPDENGLD